MRSAYQMTDVGRKAVTERIAVACGEITLSDKVIEAVVEHRLPKGDALALAEIAGLNAIKRTADILPLCHPLSIDAASIQTAVEKNACRIKVTCTVQAHGRTGVEMEALSGASGALLCIYDLTKGIDKSAVISNIRLESKEGGKSGYWKRDSESNDKRSTEMESEKSVSAADIASETLSGAIIIVSDRCYAGEMKDASGAMLEGYLRSHDVELSPSCFVPDSINEIRNALQKLVAKKVSIILVTGGTGVGPRDVTPEALEPLWTKKLPGFGESFRFVGGKSTPTAILSRAEAGIVDRSIVALLPGSPRAVSDATSILDPLLKHAVSIVHGGSH